MASGYRAEGVDANTALMDAASFGRTEIARLLIAKGQASLSATINRSFHPTHIPLAQFFRQPGRAGELLLSHTNLLGLMAASRFDSARSNLETAL